MYYISILINNFLLLFQAIENKDFDTFAQLTMADSNQLHAICLDTYPPCVYMNQVSHQIVRLVHQINQVSNCTKVSYINNVCFIKIRTKHKRIFINIFG